MQEIKVETYKTFSEWIDEQEGFVIRYERFMQDVDDGDLSILTEWLRTAWELGRASANQ